MNELKYVIMHQGYYIKESAELGEFDRTPYIEHANEFSDLDMLQRYIENELKLNLANVSIKEIKTITTYTNLILFNGKYVNSATVDYCVKCDELHLVHELHWYRANNIDKPELYCTKCYDEIDSNYPNVIGNQAFDEEAQNEI